MRKKVNSLLLAMLVLVNTLAISTTNAQCKEISSSKMFNECMEIGYKFLYDYYYAIDMKQDMDMTKYVNGTELVQYLDLKQDIMKNRMARSKCEVSNFSVDTSCYDYLESDNKVEITYNVLVKHQYNGCTEMSESMQQVKLGFENVSGLMSITNYFEFTDFDINVSLKQSKTADTQQSLTVNSSENSSYQLDFSKESIGILEDVLDKENEFYDKRDSEVELYKMSKCNKTAQLPSVDTSNSVSLLSVGYTARSNMVSYATTNCDKNSPSSGNSSKAPYYDFSDIQYAYDCTNFMSHCLLAGGASENHNNWYYDGIAVSQRSSSWSGVNEFHSFIVNNTGTGPKAEARSLTYSCPPQYINWESGDIVQIQEAEYNYPGFGHSTMITGTYAQNSYCTIPMITSRTADNWYTKNEVLTVKYPLGDELLAYRLIHITDLS